MKARLAAVVLASVLAKDCPEEAVKQFGTRVLIATMEDDKNDTCQAKMQGSVKVHNKNSRESAVFAAHSSCAKQEKLTLKAKTRYNPDGTTTKFAIKDVFDCYFDTYAKLDEPMTMKKGDVQLSFCFAKEKDANNVPVKGKFTFCALVGSETECPSVDDEEGPEPKGYEIEIIVDP